jgi:methyl-accepting chemotaxis protein
MKNIRIATQLALGFGLMVLLVLLSGVMLWAETRQSEQRALVARHATTGAVALAEAESALWQLRYGFPQFMTGDEAARKKIVDDEPKHYKTIGKALETYAASDPSEEERKSLKVLHEIYGKYIAARPKWFELYGAGKLDEAKDWRAATTTPFGAGTVKAFSEQIDLQQKVSLVNHEEALRELQSTRQWMLLLAAVAVVAGVVLASVSTLSVTHPIGEAVSVARRVADGDLAVQVQARGTNETGQLLHSLSGMAGSLRTLVGEVANGARAVADTSAQIAQGNLDLSQRTEEQASTLEETASSMEELTSTVTQNAQNANQATQLAVNATEVARKGGQVVGQVVSTMTGISDSSKKIADIIGVIDGIAFQTNILALNAAVEAARAGEQGRGFAVVAAEVRNLAQRSAAAAKEIKGLIGDSVGKVEAGTKLVDAAGKTMEEIVVSVKKVSDLIAEIAAASQEQSTGIGQVNTAIAQMDQVVQQNASLVEEAAAATESMKDQARSLLATVARFNLGDEAAASRQSRPPAPLTAAIAPIKASTHNPLPPAYAGLPQRAKAASGNGQWKEF